MRRMKLFNREKEETITINQVKQNEKYLNCGFESITNKINGFESIKNITGLRPRNAAKLRASSSNQSNPNRRGTTIIDLSESDEDSSNPLVRRRTSSKKCKTS